MTDPLDTLREEIERIIRRAMRAAEDVTAIREAVAEDSADLILALPEIRDALSAAEHVAELREALRPFAALYDQIIADHGSEWFADDGGCMRASLSYPVAKDPVRWSALRRAAKTLSKLPAEPGDGR